MIKDKVCIIAIAIKESAIDFFTIHFERSSFFFANVKKIARKLIISIIIDTKKTRILINRISKPHMSKCFYIFSVDVFASNVKSFLH